MDTLRLLLKTFYAPVKAMDDARSRVPLGSLVWAAVIVQTGLWFIVRAGRGGATVFGFYDVYSSLVLAAIGVLFIISVFAPLVVLARNVIKRERSLRAALSEDFAATASCVLLAWTAASVFALVATLFVRIGGGEEQLISQQIERWREIAAQNPQLAGGASSQVLSNPFVPLFSLTISFMELPFLVFALIAIRTVWRDAWWRVILTLIIAAIGLLVTLPLWVIGLAVLYSFPFFLVLFLFLFARETVGRMVAAQQARARFKQNLEAATLNPADASAHYNLGLIHLARHERPSARERFARTIEIDADYIDAHFQLGRIARLEKNFAAAISHFEQVVTRDTAHAQYEIWREIGATYLDANQPQDAVDALERFIEHRPDDAEGLYLLGRALAAEGQTRRAAELMRRCIEAVKTAPAYKYKLEKRWLKEAETFLRANAVQQ